MAVLSSDMPALTGYAATANSTMYNAVYTASYNAMDLGAILPLLSVAVLILTLVVGGFKALNASGFLNSEGTIA